MKKINFRNLILALLTIVNVQNAYASTISPDDIRDGVVNVIDVKQIEDLLVWAKNSKTELEDGLKIIADLPRNERHKALSELVWSVVGSSGDLGTELLMRSVLKRARNLDNLLNMAPSTPERETMAIHILEDSARWAIDLYQSDEEFLTRAANGKIQNSIQIDLDFATLGREHGSYVLSQLWLSPNLFTRIAIVKESLSYFYNDLNRDNVARRNPAIANVLLKIANFAEKKGLDKPNDEYLKYVAGLNDKEKLNLAREIELFYKDQLDKAADAIIERPRPNTNIERPRPIVEKERPPETDIFPALVGGKLKFIKEVSLFKEKALRGLSYGSRYDIKCSVWTTKRYVSDRDIHMRIGSRYIIGSVKARSRNNGNGGMTVDIRMSPDPGFKVTCSSSKEDLTETDIQSALEKEIQLMW